MPDTKITALTAISTVDPAVDVLPIVDVSDTTMAASGTTKKITSNQILGAGGTATLASATITGDLTVDTSTFKVNSGNNNVGIGFAGNASSGRLQISQPLGSTIDGALRLTDDATTSFVFNNVSSGLSAIWSSGSIAFGVGSGTFAEAMRLNSTGLGVGLSAHIYKLQSVGFVAASSSTVNGSGGNLIGALLNSDDANSGVNPGLDIRRWTGSALNHGVTYIGTNATGDTLFYNGSVSSNTRATSLKMTLDASGNLLLGTTNTSTTAGVGLKSLYNATVPSLSMVVNDAAGTGAAYLLYNTNAAAYRFYVANSGTIFATNTTISAISDARLKENVQDIDVGLGAILALKPRKFDWKAGKGKDIKGDRGFIAQEFEQVFPNLIDEWKDAAPEGEAPYKSVRQDLIPVLVKAIQELTARVQTLEAR